jgi:hypothetical protein
MRNDPARPCVEFAVTLKRTSPGPFPDCPPVTLIQFAALEATQLHPGPVRTETTDAPPA